MMSIPVFNRRLLSINQKPLLALTHFDSHGAVKCSLHVCERMLSTTAAHRFFQATRAGQPNEYHRHLLASPHVGARAALIRHASRLTSKQINHILRMREMQHTGTSLQKPVQSLWSSQLAANYPIEDRRVFAQLPHSEGYLIGVIDGHGGSACAQALKEWLPAYIAAALMPFDKLEQYADSLSNAKQFTKPEWSGEASIDNGTQLQPLRAVKNFLDPTDYVRSEVFSFCQHSLQRYACDELDRRRNNSSRSVDSVPDICAAIERACCCFDNDISENATTLKNNARAREPQPNSRSDDAHQKRYAGAPPEKSELPTESGRMLNYSKPDLEKLSIALSGAVAIFAYVRDRDLFVASTGDCSAALAEVDGSQLIVTYLKALPFLFWHRAFKQRLNTIHTVENTKEVERLKSEHPPGEASALIKADRLLGQLLPLRSFGDMQYKWPLELQRTLFRRLQLMHYTPPNYITPPYLTARPEVRHFRLKDNAQQFIMLTSDGLIEWMNEEQACKVVYDHTLGKKSLEPFDTSKATGMTLNALSALLTSRKSGLIQKPEDENVATHLIRFALGMSPEKGVLDTVRLSRALSVPLDQARYTRDDFTVTVAFFDFGGAKWAEANNKPTT